MSRDKGSGEKPLLHFISFPGHGPSGFPEGSSSVKTTRSVAAGFWADNRERWQKLTSGFPPASSATAYNIRACEDAQCFMWESYCLHEGAQTNPSLLMVRCGEWLLGWTERMDRGG